MTNRMPHLQVASLILAFLILTISLPLGHSLPEGDVRTLCGVAALASLTWIVAFLTFAPRD